MTNTIVALYDTVQAAERAVRDLHTAGVSDRDISLMAADTKGEYGRGAATSDGSSAAEKGAGLGAALGGLGGLLVGLGALTIPGIGPVVAAGPLATAVAALAGAGAGALAGGAAGGLLGALVDAGLPREQAEVYAEGVRRGGTLLAVRLADDSTLPVETVRDVLERHDPVDVDERAATWRQQGWSGYDTNAGPYAADRLDAGQARMSNEAARLGNDAALMGSEAAMRSGVGMSEAASRNLEAGAAQGSAAVYAHGQATPAGDRMGQQPADRVTASDYDRFAPAFRGHYQTSLAQSGFQYEHYEPAYQYGLTLGNYEPYRGLDWMQIEPEARHAWEERNPNTWDRIRDAVRYGWERVKMPVR